LKTNYRLVSILLYIYIRRHCASKNIIVADLTKVETKTLKNGNIGSHV